MTNSSITGRRHGSTTVTLQDVTTAAVTITEAVAMKIPATDLMVRLTLIGHDGVGGCGNPLLRSKSSLRGQSL